MDIAAIKARIAELEQRKAERNAMRGYRDVSYLDYMVNNDRSGFDRIDASEQAYRNMIEQQKFHDDQRQATQLFNEQQREIDRELSRELAEKQREEQTKYTQNDIMNKYELANTDYELALQTFNADDPSSIANLKRKAQMLNHYGSQLGFEPVSTDAPGSRPKTGVEEQKDYEGIASAALSNKSWTDEIRNQAFEAANNVKDVTKRNELLTKIANRGSTKEDKARTLNAANEEFKKNGKKNPNTKLYKVIFVNNKPDHLEYK